MWPPTWMELHLTLHRRCSFVLVSFSSYQVPQIISCTLGKDFYGTRENKRSVQGWMDLSFLLSLASKRALFTTASKDSHSRRLEWWDGSKCSRLWRMDSSWTETGERLTWKTGQLLSHKVGSEQSGFTLPLCDVTPHVMGNLLYWREMKRPHDDHSCLSHHISLIIPHHPLSWTPQMCHTGWADPPPRCLCNITAFLFTGEPFTNFQMIVFVKWLLSLCLSGSASWYRKYLCLI